MLEDGCIKVELMLSLTCKCLVVQLVALALVERARLAIAAASALLNT
jgi:hypothetical protein